jgi:hypothetical protein
MKTIFLLQMEMLLAAATPVIFSSLDAVGFVSCLLHLPAHGHRP